jgi:RHS repeat-associated protein
VKVVKPNAAAGEEDQWHYTYYIRDAQGNILATYQRYYLSDDSLHNWEPAHGKFPLPKETRNHYLQIMDYYGHSHIEVFRLNEHHLYGSSRLGIQRDTTWMRLYGFNGQNGFDNQGYFASKLWAVSYDSYLPNPNGDPLTGNPFTRAFKQYELTNHLGNVLATVSDRSIQVSEPAYNKGFYFAPDIWQVSDYYPYGMQKPGRAFHAGGYRFGFNGKESDDEIYGSENSLDFGARIYDPRLGRWLSVDPLASKLPDQSPYAGFNNNPILFVDPDGMEGRVSITVKDDGTTIIELSTTVHVFGDQVTDEKVRWMQEDWDRLDRPFALDPSETGGNLVIVNINITYVNANDAIEGEEVFRQTGTGQVHHFYLNDEIKQAMNFERGDNLMQIDSKAWGMNRKVRLLTAGVTAGVTSTSALLNPNFSCNYLAPRWR